MVVPLFSIISLDIFNLDWDLLMTMQAKLYSLIVENFPKLQSALERFVIGKAIRTSLSPIIHGYVTARVDWLVARVKSFFSKKKKG